MNFLRPLNHTGLNAYVWSGAVGANTDLTAIDPKKSTSNSPGRNCVGIYVGSAGNLLVETRANGGTKNMYYAGVPAGAFIDGSFSKVLASGNVNDEATGGSTGIAKTSTAKDLVVYWEV